MAIKESTLGLVSPWSSLSILSKKIMPSMDATTTAVFTSVGLNASSIYTIFTNLIGTAVSFSLWMIQVAWPFWLAIGLILMLLGLARRYHFFGRS